MARKVPTILTSPNVPYRMEQFRANPREGLVGAPGKDMGEMTLSWCVCVWEQ